MKDQHDFTFCEECRDDVSYLIKNVSLETTLKGEKYSYIGKKAFCSECGAEVYVAEINDQNLKALYHYLYLKIINIHLSPSK